MVARERPNSAYCSAAQSAARRRRRSISRARFSCCCALINRAHDASFHALAHEKAPDPQIGPGALVRLAARTTLHGGWGLGPRASSHTHNNRCCAAFPSSTVTMVDALQYLLRHGDQSSCRPRPGSSLAEARRPRRGLPPLHSSGSIHAVLERRTEQIKRSLFLLDLEIYRRLLTAVVLNLILNGLSFVERH
jgi:hypothetical protein